MAVARSDEGSSNVAGNVARRRLIRKPMEVAAGSGNPAPTALVQPPPSTSPLGSTAPPGTKLDDLYRLPMPKLFAFAEREGVAEHTGMNRGQLIVAVVRQQIERGEDRPRLRHPRSPARRLRLPAQRRPTIISLRRKTFTSRRARFAASASRPAWSSRGRSACRSRARTISP